VADPCTEFVVTGTLAVFSDVHANLVALEAFLEAVRGIADEYLCLGDTVGYGPWNDECLELLADLPLRGSVEGNHERLFASGRGKELATPLVQQFYMHSAAFFSRRDLIDNLQPTVEVGPYLCVHTLGERNVYCDTEIELTRHVTLGHSHQQFNVRRSNRILMNPGSIGQNRTWIDMVDFLLLDMHSGAITMRSIPYAVDQFIGELRTRGYPQDCIAYYANKPRRCS
jgi:predicted phosphodiesterase